MVFNPVHFQGFFIAKIQRCRCLFIDTEHFVSIFFILPFIIHSVHFPSHRFPRFIFHAKFIKVISQQRHHRHDRRKRWELFEKSSVGESVKGFNNLATSRIITHSFPDTTYGLHVASPLPPLVKSKPVRHCSAVIT